MEGSSATDTGVAGEESSASASTEGKESPAPQERSDAAAQSSSGRKALTLLIYLCGSDLESKTGAASRDLEEILASGMDPGQVNVVVMAGGTTAWQNGFSSEETAAYAVFGTSSDDLHWEKTHAFHAQDQENAPANMGEPQTLLSFLDYGYEAFPAQQYALIMWDHGGGPMRGLCWDTAWGKDNLTMAEFTGALADSPFGSSAEAEGPEGDGEDLSSDMAPAPAAGVPLAWIGFDACLMSSIETAHLMAPYARFMIASEETEPSTGWSYEFLKEIEKDSDGSVTGKRIIDSYFKGAESEGKDHALTLSCTDLSALAYTEQCMEAFFSEISAELDSTSYSDLSHMRQETREFGRALTDSQRLDLVDLGDLITHFAPQAPEKAAPLQNALEEMVTYSRSTLSGCSGLSTYHPYYNKTYYEKLWQLVYDSFEFVPSYTEYIKGFASIWMGETLGDWTQMNRVQAAGAAQDIQYFSVQLTPEQLEYYASGELLVLSQLGAEANENIEYAQVYLTNDVTLDENGVLTAGYNGRTLYATDENGQPIAGPLSYSLTEDGHLQIEGNYLNHESGARQEKTTVLFECEDAPPGTDLPVLDQYVWDQDAETWSNRLQIIEEDYRELILLLDYKGQTYRDGRILPFEQWEDTGYWSAGYRIPLPSVVHFRFFDQILTGTDGLYACFQVTDTQANRYGTELMAVNNPMVTPIRFEGAGAPDGGSGEGGEQSVIENDQLRFTVSGKTDHSELSKALMLDIVVENLSDQPVSVSMKNGTVTMNGTTSCFPSRGEMSSVELDPGKKRASQLYFDDLSLAGISEVSEIKLEITWEEKPSEAEDPGGAAADQNDPVSADSDATAAEDSGTGDAADQSVLSQEIILHPLHLDLSGIGERIEDLPVLAELSRDGLQWQLLEMRRKRNGNPVFLLHSRNEGTQPAAVPDVTGIAVNGFVMNQIAHSERSSASDPVLIHPGSECVLCVEAENRQYDITRFEHVGGLEHLAVSDVLRSCGVTEITSVTLYPFTSIGWWGDADEALEQPVLHFELTEPLPLTPLNSREEEIERDRFYSEEAPMRSLDEEGSLPERVLLSSRGGVNVYGEQVLIADRKVLYSLIIENEGTEDAVLRMYNFFVNGVEVSTFQRNYIAYAGSSMRRYIRFECPEEVESDGVKQLSMSLWQDGKELPSVERVTFTFDDGADFNVDGGITMPLKDAHPTVDLLSTEEDTPLFQRDVLCPEDPEQYRREVRFSLPESITEEQRASIRQVTAFVMSDCTAQMDPEKIAEVEQANDHRSGLFRKPVGRVNLQKAEGADVFTGVFPGLTACLKEHPEFCMMLTEPEETPGQGRFLAFAETSYYYKLSLLPKKEIFTVTTEPGCLFRINLEDAVLEDLTLTENSKYSEYFKLSNWPTSWFEKLKVNRFAEFCIPAEDGTLEMPDSGIVYTEQEIPISEIPLTVRLVPVTEYAENPILTYRINFEDGSMLYFDGGSYE